MCAAKPQRRPPPEPPRRPPSGPNNVHRRPPAPMGMGPLGQAPMMGMPPPFGMMPPSRGPPMFGGDFGPMGGFPPGRANGPMGMGRPMRMGADFDRQPSPGRFPVGGPPKPPPRALRDSHRDGGPVGGSARSSDWQREPDLLGDTMNGLGDGFDDDQPFEDQAPRRGLGDGLPPRGLLMGARDSGLMLGAADRTGQGPPTRRMPSGGIPDYPMARSKR